MKRCPGGFTVDVERAKYAPIFSSRGVGKTGEAGFTLIETLVYLALFAIMIGGIVLASYMLFESSDRNQAKAMLQEEKNFLLSKINYALSGAKTVSASGATLAVSKYDGTSATISLSGTDLWWNSSSRVLNNTNVKISNLSFVRTLTGTVERVEGSFTISGNTPEGTTISQVGSTTVYLRK